MQYFFILGRIPSLSLAEILAFFERKKIKIKIIEFSSEAIILKTEEKIDAFSLIKKLGGTIKIGEILFLGKKEEIKPSLISSQLKKEKRINFGFSLYRLQKISLSKIYKKIKEIALETKKILKKKGFSCRLVTSSSFSLSSVIVEKNKLLEKGGEFVILAKKNSFYFGKTKAVQEFEEYEKRDFGRPSRAIEQGMIPPKLAKIMINLGRIKKREKILDPFCGSGTILQEALLLGYQNIWGSDLNPQAIEFSQKNLSWLRKKYHFPKTYHLFQANVLNLPQKLKGLSFDAIVTEPYLGPLLKKKTSFQKIKKIKKELSSFYLNFFPVFKKILKTNGKVIIVFPIFQKGPSLFLKLEILEEIEKMGFRIINLLPKRYLKIFLKNLPFRKSLIYFRPKQKVWREIFLFQKISKD